MSLCELLLLVLLLLLIILLLLFYELYVFRPFVGFFLELQCQQDSLELQNLSDDSCTIK